MKKLFFTAIALVAFTGVSVANTIEENTNQNSISDKQLNVKTEKEEATVTDADCGGVWGSTRIYALNQGFSADQASCIAMAAYIACIGFNDASEDVKKATGTLC